MGKRGKKQKQRPKIKDKKQSERFKKTAREVGADKPSDHFDSLLATLARVAPSLPPEPQIPTSSQLLGINVGGIAMLADGTAWRIAPNDLARAKRWIEKNKRDAAPCERTLGKVTGLDLRREINERHEFGALEISRA